MRASVTTSMILVRHRDTAREKAPRGAPRRQSTECRLSRSQSAHRGSRSTQTRRGEPCSAVCPVSHTKLWCEM
eukprot:5829386-Prymnesium_polylepis.1